MIPSEHLVSFNYQKVPAELRLADPANYCVDLEIAARRLLPPDAHIIHDVSWVLTQVEASDRATLDACRDSIVSALTDAYGPHVFNVLAKANLTVETLLLPVAKKLRRRADGALSKSDDGDGEAFGISVPDPEFAATHARIMASLVVVRHLPATEITAAQCGERLFIGRKKDCKQCDGGLRVKECVDDLRKQARNRHGSPGDPEVPENIARELFKIMGDAVQCLTCRGAGVRAEDVEDSVHPRANEARALIRSAKRVNASVFVDMGITCPACHGKGFDIHRMRSAAATPTQTKHTFRELAEYVMDPGAWIIDDWVSFFGNDIYCRRCSLWIDVPKDARTNWVLPVTDSAGTSVDVHRLEMTT